MSKVKTPNPVRGTQDMFGETEERFAHVVATFERVRKLYGFKGLQLPVMEPTAVFARTLGETTDVVSKEMYSFEDRGGDSITLRPEFTAGICRAYLTNGWQQHAPMKLSVHGPLFRYERPQKGRYRQFHQIDAEIIGAAEPAADVELLVMADQLLKELKIDDGVSLHLNTLGDAESRDAWRAALVEYFNDHDEVLSEDSMRRLKTNPLRILDSKDPDDRGVCHAAPKIDAYLTAQAQDFFAGVTSGLDAADVAWKRSSALVRGFDYYRHTAFEFITDRLGAQGTVLGGGRYDGLIEHLGGPHTPAVGWAAGIERLAMLLDAPASAQRVLALVVESDEQRLINVAGMIAKAIRHSAGPTLVYQTGSVRKRFDKAVKTNPAIILVLQKPEAQGEVARLTIKRLVTDTSELDTSLRLAPANLLRSMFRVEDAQWTQTILSGGTVSLLSYAA
jgi:histidyl-tRNA synthetase